MKVLFVCQGAYSAYGGIQRFNRRVIQALKSIMDARTNAKDEFNFIARNDNVGDVPSSLNRHITKCKPGALNFFYKSLKGAISSDALILGHINMLPIALFAKILNPRVQVTMFAHGVEVWHDAGYRKRRWWEPRALAFAVDQVAAVSNYTIDRFSSGYGYPRERCALFPNAVDISTDAHFDHNDSERILVVTRLASSERQKNVDLVIKAAALLLKEGRPISIDIVGDGDLKDELQTLARQLGVDSYCTFHGAVSDDRLDTLYQSNSIFVLPSTKEGFGIVYLEAWKRGLAVVGANASAVPEIVDNGIDGILVDNLLPQTLADAVKLIANDGELRRRMAQAGYRKAVNKYSNEKFTKRLESLLNLD